MGSNDDNRNRFQTVPSVCDEFGTIIVTPESIKPVLLARAGCMSTIRRFFQQKDLIEVDTRSLDLFSVTDPYMSAFKVQTPGNQFAGYLQTSPEYAMKRLLSFGSGDIFQLGKAFRADEHGNNHDCEFTMLEWYRTGFGLKALMEEVSQLIKIILEDVQVQYYSYQEIFVKTLHIDPMTVSDTELELFAREKLGDIPLDLLRDNYLSLLFSELIEPELGADKLTFIYHYPASQASLAKIIESDGLLVAERFEAYYGELELANGFHELTDPAEQVGRFNKDNEIRQQLGQEQIAIDNRLIEALENGLPDCSGVALGVDRLLMIRLGQNDISRVLPLG